MDRRVFLKLNRKKTYRKRKLVIFSSPLKIKRVAFSPRPSTSNPTPLSTPKSKRLYGKRPHTPSSLRKKPKRLNFEDVRKPESIHVPVDTEKVQVGKDQEKTQSEKDSHSKNQGGKKPN